MPGFELALVGLIAFFAGFIQGLSGFGSALVAMPLLLFFMDARTAVPFCILVGLLITLQVGAGLRKHLDFSKIAPLFFGCLPGIVCGTYLLKHSGNLFARIGMGSILVCYSMFQLCFKPKPLTLKPYWGVAAGFLTGLIGASFSAGGPPTIIYASLNRWDKDAIKATLTGFFFLTGLLIATAHAAAGITSLKTLELFMCSAPSVILGTLLGTRTYQRISHGSYLKLIYILLFFMGITLFITR